MKNLFLITSLFISTLLLAQTKVTVTVASFNFTSPNITITAGDTVEFVNVSGFHSIDGTQATYPGNPVSFDNLAQAGSGWTYTQVFNTVGAYDYRCGIHTTSMFGTITVQTGVGINEKINVGKNGFYPNPASKELNFPDYKTISSIVVYSLTGEKVLQSSLVKEKLDISEFKPGTYFVKVITEKEETTKKLIVK